MAAVYRQYQLDRGEVRPIKERAAERPELAYAAKAPEVRVRLGWKPVPSPVPEQNAENEPEMHVAITFERFKQIVDEFQRQGIKEAEFCLVGWNIGGHDGRYPQIFPPDERLGGEQGLKDAVAYAQSKGYQVVCHQNYSDAYRASQIGGLWDEGFLLVKKDGSFASTIRPWLTKKYNIPQLSKRKRDGFELKQEIMSYLQEKIVPVLPMFLQLHPG